MRDVGDGAQLPLIGGAAVGGGSGQIGRDENGPVLAQTQPRAGGQCRRLRQPPAGIPEPPPPPGLAPARAAGAAPPDSRRRASVNACPAAARAAAQPSSPSTTSSRLA